MDVDEHLVIIALIAFIVTTISTSFTIGIVINDYHTQKWLEKTYGEQYYVISPEMNMSTRTIQNPIIIRLWYDQGVQHEVNVTTEYAVLHENLCYPITNEETTIFYCEKEK